jgi:hypothetical protein
LFIATAKFTTQCFEFDLMRVGSCTCSVQQLALAKMNIDGVRRRSAPGGRPQVLIEEVAFEAKESLGDGGGHVSISISTPGSQLVLPRHPHVILAEPIRITLIFRTYTIRTWVHGIQKTSTVVPFEEVVQVMVRIFGPQVIKI